MIANNQKHLKILLINKYFYMRGGAEKSFFQTAGLLRRKGHKTIFFSMKNRENLPTEYSNFFINEIDYESKSLFRKVDYAVKLLYSFEARKKIFSLIKQTNPDVAHLNNIYHQLSPSIIDVLKTKKIPMIMTLRDYKIVCPAYTLLLKEKVCECFLCKNKRYYHCLLNKCVKDAFMPSLLNTVEMYLHHNILNIYNAIDCFVSPSLFLKNAVEKMRFAGKVVYLPNCVDLKSFNPRFDWEENDRSIVFFGRLAEGKGLPILLEAIKDLPIKLKIVGSGPNEAFLKEIVAANQISNVEFLGYKDGIELQNIVRNSLFVVLPSDWFENNPRSIIEGFALGKPAIGARIGGIPELIKENETGLTFAPGDSKDLKKKILQLLDNPRLISRMGNNARSFVESNFNEDLHYDKLIDIYNYAISGACKKVVS